MGMDQETRPKYMLSTFNLCVFIFKMGCKWVEKGANFKREKIRGTQQSLVHNNSEIPLDTNWGLKIFLDLYPFNRSIDYYSQPCLLGINFFFFVCLFYVPLYG